MGGQGPGQASAYTAAHADANVNAMIAGSRWTSTNIVWSYPDSAAEFEFGGASYGGGEMATFTTLDSGQRTMANNKMDRYVGLTGKNYSEIDETASSHADIRISRTSLYATAVGYFPGNSGFSGDIWLGNTRWSGSGLLWQDGTYESTGILHEIGHAHGLKHSNETPAMPNAMYDCRSYTIMSYRSYPGSGTGSLTIATGHHPQGLMAFDLEALHLMYGKSTVDTAPHTYSFNASTGQTNRDGVPWFVPSVPCIHLCLWEASTECIFDVSTSNEVVDINLNWLMWSTFFDAMRAELGGGNTAPGNVCMPYSNTPFKFIRAGSGGGNFVFSVALTYNQIILPGNRAAYTWTGSGRNWNGTHTATTKVYNCANMDFVSFADVLNLPVSELNEPPPVVIGPTARRVIWDDS